MEDKLVTSEENKSAEIVVAPKRRAATRREAKPDEALAKTGVPEITVKPEISEPVDLTRPIRSVANKEENYKKIEWQRARDAQIVKGKFMNIEQPGQQLSFVYKAYKGDPVKRYDLNCGEIYEIPLGVAMHLNENCATPTYEYIPGTKKMIAGENPDVRGAMKITRKVNRFLFQPLNFSASDHVGINSNRILQVETPKALAY